MRTVGFKPRSFQTRVVQGDRGGCALSIPFDPAEAFGQVRAPVVVEVGGHSYRSTIFRMKGETFVPLRRSHREAAGVEPGQQVAVTLSPDDQPRVIEPPADLAALLAANPRAQTAWQALSFSHQREHVEAIEQAVRPETRQRRLERTVEALASMEE